jgi:GntR family transcriptional regulator/MocR family aminotransferase
LKEDNVRTYDMDQRGRYAKYEYLYRCLRADVRSGTIVANTRLPSKRDLAREMGVSVSTVEHALDLLVSEGYLQPRPGSGYYVLPVRTGTAPAERAPREAEAAPQVFDANANRMGVQLFPSTTWVRCMRRVLSAQNPELFDTVPLPGLYLLRREIADHLFETRGMVVDPDNVVVGAGTEFLYSRLIRMLGDRPHIATADIYSNNLVQLTRASGAIWSFVHTDFHGMRTDEVEGTGARIVHVSPANLFPIGAVLPQSRREELLSWVHAKPRRLIVEDDYDSELRYTGRALPTLFAQDAMDKVVYMNTFSKTLVPSVRISYMVLPPDLADIYQHQAGFYSCTVSSFEQAALAEFMARGHFRRHVNQLRCYYRAQRDAFVAAIEGSRLSRIVEILPMQVGTHMMLSVDTRKSDDEVVEAAHARHLRLDMLSSHAVRPTADRAHYVILNIASVERERIPSIVALLEDVFADDVVRAEA